MTQGIDQSQRKPHNATNKSISFIKLNIQKLCCLTWVLDAYQGKYVHHLLSTKNHYLKVSKTKNCPLMAGLKI